MNILITGATGFLGGRLLHKLSTLDASKVVALVRQSHDLFGHDVIVVPDFAIPSDLSAVLGKQEIVIHTAARTHVMSDDSLESHAEYRQVNVEGTLNIARQAAESGVKRFIFISSIKVNGESTPVGSVFTAEADPAPEDAYGISKWEAEQELQKLQAETEMELVIIRPPLIYGPGVKGNFATLGKVIKKGLPLPLGCINNKRTLVSVDNLVDLIITCIDHPAAANQVFLAGDGKDVSTTELLRGVAQAMGKPSRLIPVPASLLMLAATLLGKKAMAQRLLGSLQVDMSKARDLLGWEPPISVEEGLKRCFK